MDNKPKNLGEDILDIINKDFIVIGSTRMKSWHAWLVFGLILGLVMGVALVVQRGRFEFSKASSIYGPQTSITCPVGSIDISPGTSIQDIVNTNAGNVTFCIKTGIHNITRSITPKTGNTFIGEFGAILDGSNWTATTVPEDAAFKSHDQDIDDVTIKNLVIRNMPQRGIHAYPHMSDRWTIDHNEIADNKYGVSLPNYAVVTYNYIHHNVGPETSTAENGGGYIAYRSDNLTIENNDISYNGKEQKILVSDSSVFRNNFVHHNRGDAIWFDTSNTNSIIEGNTVEDNVRIGIFYEISDTGTIRNNTVRRNETAVFVSTSKNTQVYNNTLEDNLRGVTYFVNCSAVGTVIEGVTFDLANNNTHDNVVKVPATGTLSPLANTLSNTGACTSTQVAPYINGSKNLIFQNNHYYVASLTTRYWTWGISAFKSWSEWQTLGQDTAGTLQLLSAYGTPPPPPPPPPPSTSTPYSGTPISIPGTIQAEQYDLGGQGVAYFDTDAGNNGGAFRTDSVDLQGTSDVGGGYIVGWTKAGEWLNYSVNIATTGSYTMTVRVASLDTGGNFHIELNGTNVSGTMSIPMTGGWQTWQNISKTINLSAGLHMIKLVMDTNGVTGSTGNINYLTFTSGTPPPDTTPPSGGSISYINGYSTTAVIGVTYSTGTDSGSGLNLSSGKIQRASATLTNGTCGTFGSFSDLVADSDGVHSDTTVANGNCYKYQYNISDNATNMATYTSVNVVKVDTSAPTIGQITAVPNPTNDTTPNYTFSSNEAGTIVYAGDCLSSTTSAVSGNNTITFNALSQGLHSNCTLKVTDTAGNQSSVLSVNSFVVDTAAPTVTINQASGQADPTSISPINFTAAFSESVSGFNNSDVVISGTAGGTKIATVTGSGANYNVAISGMTNGSVIVSIPANVSQDFAGNNNSVSTATDNSVTFATPTPIPSGQTPYSGTPYAIPGTIQAENFDNGGEGIAYHDTTVANEGGTTYRTTNVDIKATTDTGGGYAVGWNATGEWLEYTVNVVTTGLYTLELRAATTLTNSQIHLEFNGVDKTGIIAIPNTGSYNTYATVTKTGISLNSGSYVMRIFIDKQYFDLNYVKFNLQSADTVLPTINSWDVQPRTGTTSTRTVSWNVSDSGGSYLNRVEIQRAPYNASTCNDTIKTACAWNTLKTVNAPANANTWTSSTSVSQPTGTYWYGFHALDNYGNRRVESAQIKVTR